MENYTLTRSIPVDETYDLVVAGGGPAGTAAAICAGRLGARVLLVESTGSLGGMGTNGLVCNWYCLANNKEPVIGGLMLELCEELYKRKAIDPERGPEYWKVSKRGFGFEAEALKMLFDELCVAAGVEVRFVTRVIDVEVAQDGRTVNGVVLNNVEGHRYVPAKAFIDATGDAVLADLCGAPCHVAGKDTDNIMPPTLCASIANIDFNRFDRRTMQQPAVDRAVAEGYFSQPDRHVPGLFRTGETNGILNAGHLFNLDALNCRSLSDGYMTGRRLVHEYIRFYQEYLDGCEGAQNITTAALMGVRESRRVVGEYEMDADDFHARRKFPDQIAIYCKQVDIHVYAPTDEEYKRVYRDFDHDAKPADGEYYGIPYGCLVPEGWSNLWVAGRCISTDVFVNGAIRDQPACIMMGEAAGTAAVQHISTGQAANRIDTATLVNTLRERGGNLPQNELSSGLTRS